MPKKKDEAAKSGTSHLSLPPGLGTDAEIAEGCAKHLPGWNDLSDKSKADAVRLARWFQESDVIPVMELGTDGPNEGLLGPAEGCNRTLFYMRLAELLGSPSPEHLNQRTQDITRYVNKTGSDNPAQAISAVLAFVKGVEAKDTAQSALAVQMAATHDAALYALGQMRGAQFVEQAKVFGTLSAKLLNAYTRQAEVLTKMQRGGEQVVKHIHIDNRGGQAVVTEQVVAGGQGGNANREDQSYATGAASIGPAMLGTHSIRNGVPIPSCEGQEAVPHARGHQSGRA